MENEKTKLTVLEKENEELTEKLERVKSIINVMFYNSEGLHMDGKEETSELLDKYRVKLCEAIGYPKN